MTGLPESIPCPECRAAVEGVGVVSRAYVNELHWSHRPMHPNEVGGSHRARARREFAAWEALSPYSRT